MEFELSTTKTNDTKDFSACFVPSRHYISSVTDCAGPDGQVATPSSDQREFPVFNSIAKGKRYHHELNDRCLELLLSLRKNKYILKISFRNEIGTNPVFSCVEENHHSDHGKITEYK